MSKRSYISREEDKGSWCATSRVKPRTFEFEESEETFTNHREPHIQRHSSPGDGHAFTGPHSPVHSREHSRDPAVYVEEYTTTYTKIVRSTEHLDSIPSDPEPLLLPSEFSEFERLESNKPRRFSFEEIDQDSSLIGFGSDRFDFASSGGTPRRTKSLSSFHDVDDDDYGLLAVRYSKSPVPSSSNKISGPVGRQTTSGGQVLKSVEKWETESYNTNGNLYRSSSEKRVSNGMPDKPSHKNIDVAALRAQSLRDLSNRYAPDASAVTVEYHQSSQLESTPAGDWEDRVDAFQRQHSSEVSFSCLRSTGVFKGRIQGGPLVYRTPPDTANINSFRNLSLFIGRGRGGGLLELKSVKLEFL